MDLLFIFYLLRSRPGSRLESEVHFPDKPVEMLDEPAELVDK